MKKVFAVLLALAFAVSLAACSSGGVSQSEYDAVVAERDQLKQQLEALQQTDAGSPSLAASSENVVNQEKTDYQPLVLLDSGYSLSQTSRYMLVSYAVQIENPNADAAVQYPKIIITARDESWKILSNEEQILMGIAAGDTITYGNYFTYEGALASTVEISVSTGDDNYTQQDDASFPKTEVFTFSNTSETPNGVTGEITNASAADFSSVAVSLIYKKEGRLLGGTTDYIDDLAAGSTQVFDIRGSQAITDYDEIELRGMVW